MKKVKKFIIPLFMSIALVFTMMPGMAWADETVGSEIIPVEEPVQEPSVIDETVGGDSDLVTAAEESPESERVIFKGTAKNGNIASITFDEKETAESADLASWMQYTFNPVVTEYTLKMPDHEIGSIKWKANDGVADKGYKAAIAYYDDEKAEWKDIASNRDVSVIINGIQLPTDTMTYDKPTVIRFAVGPLDDEMKVDVESEYTDIYYFSITREAVLAGIDAGTDYPLSPAFGPYKNGEYYVYGDFTEDTEINLTLKTGNSVVAKENKVTVNGTDFSGGELSRKYSAKYMELYQDIDGRKYAKINVTGKGKNGEDIPGRSYSVYFLNEQKVKFTEQPQGGTFSPVAGGTHKLSVKVDIPEEASVAYKWDARKYTANTDSWSTFSSIHITSSADKNTATTDTLTVKLDKAGTFEYRCKVTLTIDGTDYVAYSDTATVVKTDGGKVSAPNVNNIFMTPRTYYQYENAVQLAVGFSSIDAGAKTTMQWYVSEKEDGSEAVALQTEAIIGKETYGCSGAVTPDTSKTGTFYYYCVGTCTLEEEGETYTAQKRSDLIKIEIKPINVSLSGDGSEGNPYLITSIDDLKEVKDAVNEDGITFANRHLKLTAEEITLPSDWEGLGCEDMTIMDTYVSHIKPFSGILDGDGKLIKMENGCKGLINKSRDAVVKNLNLYGEQIDGSALVFGIVVDYGLDRQYSTGCPSPITAENVVLKTGSRTKGAGLVGGISGSGANNIIIRDCKIEDGVTVGYTKDEQTIGSFVDALNGTIINSSSAADVYGSSNVGGFAGSKGQSMGNCMVMNSSFTGTITATGIKVGGIMGSGYESESAPNTPVVTIINCYVDAEITGRDYIGGIFGSEGGVVNCFDNGVGSIDNNSFYGTITATDPDARFVGGTIGFLRSFNKNQGIDCNYYLDTCGADKGVGYIQTLHTTGTNAVDKDFDITKTCLKASAEEFQNGTVLKGLQAGKRSYKNWLQGENYPVHSSEPVLYAIELSGTYKTEYVTGDAFSTDGMVITGKVSDGSTKNIALDDSKLKFTGFQSNKRGVQTITVTYGAAEATYDVTVLYNESQVKDISVYFTLLGDSLHGEPTADGGPHTLSGGGIKDEWVRRTEVTITNNTTVYDVLKQVLTSNGITWEESYNLGTAYIKSMTRNGVTLGEFDNGNLSGWMYTINGVHSSLGVAEQFLNNGDRIVFHYTDDYTQEQGSENWGVPVQPEEKNEVTTGGAAGTAITTTPTEVTVVGSTATATVTKGNITETLKQATENKSAEIVLQVSAADTKGAATVKVQLDTAAVKDIAEDTTAALTVKTENGTVSLDQEALKTVAAEAAGSTVTLEIVEVKAPTAAQKTAAGENGHVIQLVIKSGNKVISLFNEGKATVTVEIPAKLHGKQVAAIHIGDDGKIEHLKGQEVTVDGKQHYRFDTPHFSTFALVDADEIGLEIEEETMTVEEVKAMLSDLTPVVRSVKTANKNIKVTLKLDKSDKAIIEALEAEGFTVKYNFYRSTKKSSKYSSKLIKEGKTYTNTKGVKNKMYYYKARVQVYDEDGNLIARTALKQCKYANRKWTKQ